MSWAVLSRALSAAITIALALLISNYSNWTALVIGFGLAHYLLSFYYAGSRIRVAVGSPAMALPFASLLVLLLVVFFLEFPLSIYFGIHHAFNEGYLRRFRDQARNESDAQLTAPRALFHLAAYFCIIRSDPYVSQLHEPFLWSFLAVSVALYLQKFRAVYPGSGIRSIVRASGVEWLTLGLVGLSFFFKITFLQIVMYHFVLWTLIPIPAIRAGGKAKLIEYGLLTAGSLTFFLVLASIQIAPGIITLPLLYSQFIFWSYVHITTSFGLSSAHPQWMVNLFKTPTPTQQ